MIKTVAEDFALLDRGPEEENRFVVIENVKVDENGHFVGGIDTHRILSSEAVKKGATRIEHSDCVDISGGGQIAANDKILYFNGGDKMLTDPDAPMTIFLEREGLLK